MRGRNRGRASAYAEDISFASPLSTDWRLAVRGRERHPAGKASGPRAVEMSQPDFTEWKPMASAPRDGTRVLVMVRASEQGPAEVDVVRWSRPGGSAEEGWIATDSDSGARFVYAEAELESWMPLPSALPKLRSSRIAAGEPPPSDEIDGAGI